MLNFFNIQHNENYFIASIPSFFKQYQIAPKSAVYVKKKTVAGAKCEINSTKLYKQFLFFNISDQKVVTHSLGAPYTQLNKQ